MAAIEGERAASGRADAQFPQPLKVIYLSGTGRSGTTLVGNALGSIPGTICIGEVKYGIRRGLVEDGHCGCQAPVRECPVWVPALEATFGHIPSREEARSLDRKLAAATRTRTAAWWLSGRSDRVSCELVETFGRLTVNVAAAAGVTTVVDSSKLPTYGMLLDRHAGLDVRVVHVVRDPRAVAWSWQRAEASNQISGFEEEMERFRPMKASMMWVAASVGTRAWGQRAGSTMYTLRYEDFVENPERHLERIARFAEIEPAEPGWLRDVIDAGGLHLTTSHSMAGNPNRVRTGDVRVQRDDEWRAELPAPQHRLISALTYASRRKHGY